MPARPGTSALGEFIRARRQMANLSLRQLSAMAQISNPYLSQVERGVHEPSVRVLRGIAEALDVSAETLLVQAGLLSSVGAPDGGTATAIMADPRLSPAQRRALLGVYRSYVEAEPDDTRLTEAFPPHEPTGTGRPHPTRRTSA